MWGATFFVVDIPAFVGISIHAPRVGSDASIVVACLVAVLISIHAPRVGSDKTLLEEHGAELISIHAPRVGSDSNISVTQNQTCHFNPRSPCGERPPLMVAKAVRIIFQSTLPVWGATKN